MPRIPPRFLAVLLVCLALGACQSAAPPASVAVAEAPRVVLVRHAETAEDGTPDPPLSDAGRQRAEALAARLGDRLVGVFATEYRRTQETAAPAAEAAGLDVTVGIGPVEVAAGRLAERVHERLAGAPPGATVLVVGHSNTVPVIAEALGGAPVAPIDHGEYDREVVVELRREGDAPRAGR